jgi:HSP20 family protein
MTRWAPFGEIVSLRDAMDRLMSESFIRPQGENSGGTPGTLAVDVREEGDNFVVSAPIPGVAPDDVEITVLGDTLRIRGEQREERQEGGEGKRWLVREQRFGMFERLVRLPSPVKADAAKADFRDGVLTATLPKTEEAKERRIPVQAGQTNGQTQATAIDASSGQGSSQQSGSGRSASTANTRQKNQSSGQNG